MTPAADRARRPAAPGWTALAPVLLGAGLLVASFLKSDWTRNDFERFDHLRLTFVYFGLFAVSAFGYALVFLERPALTARGVVAGGLGAGVLLLASFQVGSKDPFVYACIGKVWGTYHANPYAVAPAAFPADPWQPYVQVLWARQPTPYGPLFLWQTRLVDWLADGRLFVAVWAYKLIAAAALAAAIVIAATLVAGIGAAAASGAERWLHVALLAWNPLLLFESAGNGHNDALMMLWLVAAIWAHCRGGRARTWLAPALLAFGVWYKWYALLFVPSFLIAVYRDGDVRAVRRWLLALLLFGGGGALLMAPLADAAPVLAQRLVGHENLRQIFPLLLSPVLAPLLWGLDALGLVGGRWDLAWFDSIRLGLFAIVVLAVLASQWRGRVDLVGALCVMALAFVMLVVTVLWPWHVQVPVVLALLAGTRRWQALGVALTLLALLSYFFTFVWAAALLVALAAAVWLVRRVQPVKDSGAI